MTAAHVTQIIVAVVTLAGGAGFGAAAWKWWSERDERAVGTMQDVLATVKEELVKVRAELDKEREARQVDKRDCTNQLADLYRQLYAAQQENAGMRARLDAVEEITESMRTRREREGPQ